MNKKETNNSLLDFNDGLGAGLSIGDAKGWIKFDRENLDSWPDINTPLVGLFKSKRKGSRPFSVKIVVLAPEADGDGGHSFEECWLWWGSEDPAYYVPLPDPNNHE